MQGSHSCKQGTNVEAIYLPAHGQTNTQIPSINLYTQQAVNMKLMEASRIPLSRGVQAKTSVASSQFITFVVFPGTWLAAQENADHISTIVYTAFKQSTSNQHRLQGSDGPKPLYSIFSLTTPYATYTVVLSPFLPPTPPAPWVQICWMYPLRDRHQPRPCTRRDSPHITLLEASG